MSADPEFRVATVKATGRRYIVQRLYLPTDGQPSKCFCWGELTSYRGLDSKHETSKVFLLEEVSVALTPKTIGLMEELFLQNIEALRAAGAVITRTRAGNYKIVAPPKSAVV